MMLNVDRKNEELMRYAFTIKKYCHGRVCDKDCIFFNIVTEQCSIRPAMPCEWKIKDN